MGPARPVQPGAVVVALAKLDARVVACASGRPYARDFARTVPLGQSDARGRRRLARTARNDCHVLDLPAPLRECFQKRAPANTRALTLFLPFFLFCFHYNLSNRRPSR